MLAKNVCMNIWYLLLPKLILRRIILPCGRDKSYGITEPNSLCSARAHISQVPLQPGWANVVHSGPEKASGNAM